MMKVKLSFRVECMLDFDDETIEEYDDPQDLLKEIQANPEGYLYELIPWDVKAEIVDE